jgi:hypothetical protein
LSGRDEVDLLGKAQTAVPSGVAGAMKRVKIVRAA